MSHHADADTADETTRLLSIDTLLTDIDHGDDAVKRQHQWTGSDQPQPPPFSIDIHDDDHTDGTDGPAAVRIAGSGECSALAVAFNIVNTTVGAGIIGLPYALSQAGFGAGILLTILVAALTNASLILMVYTGLRVDVMTFAGLARRAFGTAGFWLVNGVVLVNGLGTMVSYMIIIGDTLAPLLGVYVTSDAVLTDRRLIISLAAVLFIFPLLLWRSVGKLARISVLGVMCVPIIVFAVAYRAFVDPAYGRGIPVDYTFVRPGIFPAVGVMAFAFVSNQTAYLNFLTLRRRSVTNWSVSTTLGVTASLVISLGLAVVGYCAFGQSVQANLLNTFPADDNWINLARFVLGCSMFVSYPMQFYPARVALSQMLKWDMPGKSPSRNQHLISTVTLFVCTLAMGLVIKDLGKVYALVGAVCSTLIAYLLPGSAIFLILYRDADGVWLTGSTRRRLSTMFPFKKQLSSPQYEALPDTISDSRLSESSHNAANRKQQRALDPRMPVRDSDQISTMLPTDVTTRSTRVNHTRRLWMCALICVFGAVALVSGTGTTLYDIFYPGDSDNADNGATTVL